MRKHLAVAASLLLSAVPAPAQNYSADAVWLDEVLRLGPGSTVADIGAGTGWLSLELAPRLGPSGRIYASELGADAVERLRQAIDTASVRNVIVVEGHPSRTNLPANCCDAIFLRRVYHHFADPKAMNASLWDSLRPGGRLAIIDFAPRGAESAEPAGRAEGDQHGITMETLTKELRKSGFRILSAEQRPDLSVYVVAEKHLSP